jgi:hypothetical protein
MAYSPRSRTAWPPIMRSVEDKLANPIAAIFVRNVLIIGNPLLERGRNEELRVQSSCQGAWRGLRRRWGSMSPRKKPGSVNRRKARNLTTGTAGTQLVAPGHSSLKAGPLLGERGARRCPAYSRAARSASAEECGAPDGGGRPDIAPPATMLARIFCRGRQAPSTSPQFVL